MSNYTKDELYNLIKQNPEEFNKWKSEQASVDLSELDFSSVTLNDIDFSDVDLNGSSFADAHLTAIKFVGSDLTAVEFTRATVLESDFSEAVLTGVDYSYAVINYCNFTDADVAGGVFQETNMENSDLAGVYNLNACRFDAETVWPDLIMLPEDFDSTCSDDLSLLRDDDDDTSIQDY
jgi:uncharacterized protein YjbI with pentapeptide repeats